MHLVAGDLIAALRDRGLRITQARRAICEVLASAGREHIDATDILRRAQVTAGSTINQSTVYRTLDVLEQLGFLHHVHLGHGPGIYHISEERDHQHLVCERCGVSVDVPLDEMAPVLTDVASRHGFVANSVHFALVGLCKDCAQS